ncbi:hypothetical protein L596_016745 [Steinernema carpocapsae]|uniref:N-terminal methionine N(alpha)-acetyltransferase NatE n=1 Tax=Steinernema carpocapsae TaxID=34508 RepID=A0A4U5NIY8_STECR|nr:hypothetical protein L596_016745 [Steinernema carpocapsae]
MVGESFNDVLLKALDQLNAQLNVMSDRVVVLEKRTFEERQQIAKMNDECLDKAEIVMRYVVNKTSAEGPKEADEAEELPNETKENGRMAVATAASITTAEVNKTAEKIENDLVFSKIEEAKPEENQKPKTTPKCAGRSDMQLGDITHHNVLQLKTINQSVFPVSYNEKFYTDVLVNPKLAKFAYFNDIVVGAVCCRHDIVANEGHVLYIMTLGALAPYRRLGVGTMLLDYVFTLCKEDKSITSVQLHVQTNNEEALDFYKKFGFQNVKLVPKYYKRIEPDSAYLLEKTLDREQTAEE